MEIDSNLFILTGNSLLYLFWFKREYSVTRRITPYSFLILWYFIVAIVGAVSYSLGVFSNVYMAGKKNLPLIDPVGLCLVLISFYILLIPVKHISALKIRNIEVTSNKFLYFEYFAGSLTIMLCVLYIPYTMTAISIDAIDLYKQGREDGEGLMPHYMYLLTTLFRILYFFFLPFCFYKLRNKLTAKYIVFLFAAFACMLQLSIISASRGMLFATVGCFFFMYVFFLHSYKKNVRRILAIWFASVVGVSSIIGFGITVSRAEASSITAYENIIGYFGESFNHFCFKIWGNESINRTNGQISFPQVYAYLTNQDAPSFLSTQDKVDYWEQKARIGNHNNFSPMFGKLYMEFGWFISLVIISAVSFAIHKYFSRYRTIHLYQFPIIGFLFSNVFFYAIFTNTVRDSIMKELVYVIIFSLFFKYLFKTKIRVEFSRVAKKH